MMFQELHCDLKYLQKVVIFLKQMKQWAVKQTEAFGGGGGARM